jgi:LPS export ABC transporter protein LptC
MAGNAIASLLTGKNLLLFFAIGFCACKKEGNKSVKGDPFEDKPVLIVKDLDAIYSDNAKLKYRLKAEIQKEYKDGRREFENGMYAEFYDSQEKVETTIKADKATYHKSKDEWNLRNDVVVINTKKQDTLLTEALDWRPHTEETFKTMDGKTHQAMISVDTAEAVEVRTPNQTLRGKGLKATQDLEWFRILDPIGEFILE